MISGSEIGILFTGNSLFKTEKILCSSKRKKKKKKKKEKKEKKKKRNRIDFVVKKI